MSIETQFSIGEEFYFLSDKKKKIVQGKVYRIDTVQESTGENKIQYWHKHEDTGLYEIVNENICFKTQEEVVQSLIG